MMHIITHHTVGLNAPVCQQHFGAYAIDEADSLCAICNGSCRNNRSDRHTMRILGSDVSWC
jgi:hypothetical protein